MEKDNCTLIIRHLPGELTTAEQEDLLRHFGASHIRCMGNQGRLKHVAFATFPNNDEASKALHRLHQLEILNCRLIAQFSHKRHETFHPKVVDETPKPTEQEEQEKIEAKIKADVSDKKQIAENINNISKKWGLEYPYNPRLQYLYPPPTVTTLANIANALASVPQFYVQVLHLMNKMCLPCPFGSLTAIPPIPDGRAQPTNVPAAEVEHKESSEESEIESEDENQPKPVTAATPQKRPLPGKTKPRKRPKLQQLITPPPAAQKTKSHVVDTAEVFEQPQALKPKKADLSLHLPGHIELPPPPAPVPPPVAPQFMPVFPPPPEATVTPPEPPAVQPEVVEGGFGKLEPVAAPAAEAEEKDEEEEELGDGRFISSHRLRKGRLSSNQMRDISVFRNYKEGEPTARYV